MNNAFATPVMQTSNAGDLALLAAHTLGFWPSEAVTLVSLRGPRRRSGLTARVDLDDLTHPEAANALGEVLIDALHRDGAAAVALLVWSDQYTHDQAAALARVRFSNQLSDSRAGTLATGAMAHSSSATGQGRPSSSSSPPVAATVVPTTQHSWTSTRCGTGPPVKRSSSPAAADDGRTGLSAGSEDNGGSRYSSPELSVPELVWCTPQVIHGHGAGDHLAGTGTAPRINTVYPFVAERDCWRLCDNGQQPLLSTA